MKKTVYKIYDPKTDLYKDRGTRISWSKEGFSWNGIPQLKVHLRQMQTRGYKGDDEIVVNAQGFRFNPGWEIRKFEVHELARGGYKISDFLEEHKK